MSTERSIKGLAKKIYYIIFKLYKNIINSICYIYDFMLFDKTIQYKITKSEINNENKKTICLIVPHVDDDILGLGGILKQYDDMDCEIHIIYTTDGCKSYHPDIQTENEMAMRRKVEAEKVKKYFNNVEIYLLNNPSMTWNEKAVTYDLITLLNKIKPNIVYFPNYIDKNIDHVKNALLISYVAKELTLEVKYRIYPVQTPLDYDYDIKYVVISENILLKKKLLDVYESQKIMKKSFDKVLWFEKMLGGKIGEGYIEIYSDIDKEKLKNLNEDFRIKNHLFYDSEIIGFGKSIINTIRKNERAKNEKYRSG